MSGWPEEFIQKLNNNSVIFWIYKNSSYFYQPKCCTVVVVAVVPTHARIIPQIRGRSLLLSYTARTRLFHSFFLR